MTNRLGATGIWSSTLRYGDTGEAAERAAELEGLGYSTLWIPDVGGDLFGPLGNLLGATSTATIATGILNVWMHTPDETAAEHARLTAEHGPRFMCGLGISHAPLIDRVKEPGTYAKPLATMGAYLDGLDAAATPLAPADRVIAALGPKMLELARTRTAGTHPYLVTPELTKAARGGIGPDGIVASEQGVVLETDPTTARADRPPPPGDLPRPAELRQQLEAPGLHRRRHRRRRQRPPRRRPRRVGRRVDDRRARPGAPRRRRRPRLHPGADERPEVVPDRAVAGVGAGPRMTLRLRPVPALRRAERLAARPGRRPRGAGHGRGVRPQLRGPPAAARHRHRRLDGHPRHQAGALGRRQHPRRRADGDRRRLPAPPAPRRRRRVGRPRRHRGPADAHVLRRAAGQPRRRRVGAGRPAPVPALEHPAVAVGRRPPVAGRPRRGRRRRRPRPAAAHPRPATGRGRPTRTTPG